MSQADLAPGRLGRSTAGTWLRRNHRTTKTDATTHATSTTMVPHAENDYADTGSWSAWDARRTIDVHIVTAAVARQIEDEADSGNERHHD